MMVAFENNDPQIVLNLIDKKGVSSEFLREFYDSLSEIFESFRLNDIKMETAVGLVPSVDLLGYWNKQAFTYNIAPQWWAIVHAEEKNSDDTDPWQLTLYFPVFESGGEFGFSGPFEDERR